MNAERDENAGHISLGFVISGAGGETYQSIACGRMKASFEIQDESGAVVASGPFEYG